MSGCLKVLCSRKRAEYRLENTFLSSKRELTEFCAKPAEFGEKLGEFPLHDTEIKGWNELPEFSPELGEAQKNSLSSVLETELSETILDPSPKFF